MQIEIFIKVVIFLIPLWIFQTLNFTKEQINYLLKLFICSAFVSGLMLIIQYIGFTLYNHDLGLYRDYTSRLAYAGLFFDFSIMSVYMSSIGSLFVVNILLRNVIFNKFIDIIFCLFFIALSVLTSARSGLFAFTSVVFLFLLFNRRFKTAIIMLLVAVPLSTFILNIFSINRQNENLLSDNGRFANFQEAYNFIIQHPFFGAGCLGYFNTTGNMDIHNFILDFLVEYGIPVTILFFVIFIMLLAKSSKTSITLFYLFLHYLIGGLFHASFINAHYIVIPIFLIAASDAVDKSNAHFKIHLWKKHIKSFL
jgi:O-antigen ligase